MYNYVIPVMRVQKHRPSWYNTVSNTVMVLQSYTMCFSKKYIIDENYALSKYNKIPLGHNRTNGAVYSKIYFKVEICSAH